MGQANFPVHLLIARCKKERIGWPLVIWHFNKFPDDPRGEGLKHGVVSLSAFSIDVPTLKSLLSPRQQLIRGEGIN